ncbi:histone H1-like [Fagus crenata]
MAITADPTRKKSKSRKPAGPKKAKASPAHPPFLEMITEAIVSLKEKTGSSQYAITKFSEEKHKQLPTNFRKLLLFHLKKLVASGKLVKVKNSFKLSPPTRSALVKKAPVAAAPVKPKTKKVVAAPKTKKVATKPKPKPKPKATKAIAAKPKPKPKVTAKPKAKVARTSTRTTPGKKAAPAKKAPKPKSVKSPAGKKAPAKKAKK